MKLKDFRNLPEWLKSNVFYRAKIKSNSGDTEWENATVEVHPLDANLISSERPNGKHALLLDLDINSYYVSSSTTGHAHLYLDTNLTLEGLTEIIGVLKKYGIVQQGIYNQVKDRGSLTLRPPGVKKGEYPDDEGIEKYKQFFEQPAKDPKVGGYLQPLPFDKKSNIKNLIDDYKKHGFKEKFSIIVPDEVFIDLLKKVCVILSVTSVETYPGAGINVDSIQVKCLGHKIMTVEDILDINAKKLTFDKSDYDNGPSKWPEWEEFIKQIGEKFSV